MNWLVPAADEQPTPSLPWLLILLLGLVVVAHGQTVLGTGNPGSPSCDLTLVVVGTAGLLYGPAFGFWIGCAGGLFHDLASSPAPIGLFALGGALLGWAAGSLWRWTVRSRWGLAGLYLALLSALHGFFVRGMLYLGGLGFAWPPFRDVLMGMGATFLLGALSYALMNVFAQRRLT